MYNGAYQSSLLFKWLIALHCLAPPSIKEMLIAVSTEAFTNRDICTLSVFSNRDVSTGPPNTLFSSTLAGGHLSKIR